MMVSLMNFMFATTITSIHLSSAFRAEKMLPITDLDTDHVQNSETTEYLADPDLWMRH
jgi:hypothetical protein